MDAHFIGEDLGQRCFAETGRPVKQHVVQRLSAEFRRVNGDPDTLFDFLLSYIIIQRLRTKRVLDIRVFLREAGFNHASFHICCSSIFSDSFLRHPVPDCPGFRRRPHPAPPASAYR